MRPLLSLFLTLVALSASADCNPGTLLKSGAPILDAQVDHGVLYFSTFGDNSIRRLDEATGQTTVIFTADAPLEGWSVVDGTIVLPLSSTELLLIAPDGTRRTVSEPAAISGLRIVDGWVYWLEANGILQRMPLAGGAAETVAVGLPTNPPAPFVIVRDRVLFTTTTGIYWQPIGSGVPLLLIAGSSLAVTSVTDDAVYVATIPPFDPNTSSAKILRVPWSGAPVETIYEQTESGYVPQLSLAAVVRGETTYILQTLTEHFFFTTSTLIVIRDGVARERYTASVAPLAVLDADEDQITLGQWVDAGGMRLIVRICAVAGRARAVAR